MLDKLKQDIMTKLNWDKNKWLITVALLVVLVVIVSLCTDNKPQATTNETVKIGISLPLTGNIANIGIPTKEAILMAKEEIDSNQNKYSYELVIENDAFEAKKGAIIANKLIHADKVDSLISAFSTIGNIFSIRAEEAGIPHISFGASDTNIATGEYNFMHWTMPDRQVSKLIEELKNKGYTNVGIITANQSGAIALLEEIKPRLDENNIFYTDQIVNDGEKDLRTTITVMRQSNPQIYVVLLFSPTLEMFTKQLKELGENKPLTSIETFNFTEDKSLFNNQWYIDAAEVDEKFAKKFKKKTNIETSYAIGNAYDALMLNYEAYESYDGEGKPSKAYIKDYLRNIGTYKGLVGEITVDEKGVFQSQAIVKTIKDGKSIPIK